MAFMQEWSGQGIALFIASNIECFKCLGSTDIVMIMTTEINPIGVIPPKVYISLSGRYQKQLHYTPLPILLIFEREICRDLHST